MNYRTLALFMLLALAEVAIAASPPIPICRLDNTDRVLVRDTFARAATAFKALGKPLPFEQVKVNEALAPGEKALVVHIIRDSNASSSKDCSERPVKNDEPLDDLSVRGGCLLVAVDSMEIRCSASAVKLFGDIGQKTSRANPALLYVLSHELGHLYQRRMGEYTGRAERIDLAQDKASKLKELQDSCDPSSTRKEEEADAIAVEVLKKLLPAAPYREPMFSDRGSLFWNIDQLALASENWQRTSLEREFISRPTVHKAFEPTEFPTPVKTIEKNAHRFVCDVLTKNAGSIFYPSKSLTHPPAEQRLMRIAEALRPAAMSLPDNSAQTQFKAVARLQGNLSPIFTQIYRETGVYMDAVQSSICTSVNSPQPPKCK